MYKCNWMFIAYFQLHKIMPVKLIFKYLIDEKT